MEFNMSKLLLLLGARGNSFEGREIDRRRRHEHDDVLLRVQQHPVPQGGEGSAPPPVRLPQLRPPGGFGEQVRVPERGAALGRGADAGAAGRDLRPDPPPHQERPLRRLRPRRGRLLPGHRPRRGGHDPLLRLWKSILRPPMEGVDFFHNLIFWNCSIIGCFQVLIRLEMNHRYALALVEVIVFSWLRLQRR